jgi:hypothetical protein
MNDERWDNLTKMINGKFEVEEEKTIDIPEGEGVGEIDIIIFNGPVGRIKLERYLRPLVLDKKTIYSKRGGSDTHVEYVYSKDEITQSMKAYKWNDFNDEWEEIKSDNIREMFG